MRNIVVVLTLLAVGWCNAALAQGTDVVEQRDLVNQGTVGIISGGIAGTYVRIAADLADAFDRGYDMRVLPVIGKGSVRNIEDLLLLRGIDIAIVQSDVLDFYKRAELFPGIEDKIAYITKLYEEEVHLLARADIASVDAAGGRKVNFGTEGSGTFMTAGIVFDELGVEVEVTTLPEPEALASLREGEIDAPRVRRRPAAEPPEPDRERLGAAGCCRSRASGSRPPTCRRTLTADVLSAPARAGRERADGRGRRGDGGLRLAGRAIRAARKVSHFVDRFFDGFDRLKQAPYHPKWQQVDLADPVPGWHRLAAARAKLEHALARRGNHGAPARRRRPGRGLARPDAGRGRDLRARDGEIVDGRDRPRDPQHDHDPPRVRRHAPAAGRAARAGRGRDRGRPAAARPLPRLAGWPQRHRGRRRAALARERPGGRARAAGGRRGRSPQRPPRRSARAPQLAASAGASGDPPPSPRPPASGGLPEPAARRARARAAGARVSGTLPARGRRPPGTRGRPRARRPAAAIGRCVSVRTGAGGGRRAIRHDRLHARALAAARGSPGGDLLDRRRQPPGPAATTSRCRAS